MNKILNVKYVYICILALLMNGAANSATLNITGDVWSATNYGGLAAFDTITATVGFNDIGLTSSGFESVVLDSMVITAGTLSFNLSMHNGLAPASIAFNNGLLADFNFVATFGTNGAPEEFISTGLGVLANRSVTTGNGPGKVTTIYDLSAFWQPVSLTPVPVPAAIWLFGSGLLGLAGFARSRKI